MAKEGPELCARLNTTVRTPHKHWSFLEAQEFLRGIEARVYRLGNGLEAVLIPDPSANSISYHSWIGVGSRHERPGKTGIAHLFEHLMFGATRNHPIGEFDRLLEAVGGETNAATWADWTSYYDNVPAGQLELAVSLEADRLANLRLSQEALDSEKEVVANERRYRVDDDIGGAAEELLYLTALGNSPYGRPTIGFMEDIESFTLKDCRSFYQRYYDPANLKIVVCGCFEEKEALTLLRDFYAKRPKKTSSVETRLPAARQPRSRQSKERRKTITWPTQAEKIHLAYHGPALGTDDWICLELLNEVLFGGTSARFVRDFVLDKEVATDADGSLTPFLWPGLWEISLGMRPDQRAKEVLPLLDKALASLCRRGVRSAEVEEAKNRIELSYWQGIDTPYGKADQVGFYTTVLGDPCAGPKRLAKLLKLRPSQLREVAGRYLQPSKRSVVYVESM